MKITNPLIELLAIKLYEHDTVGDSFVIKVENVCSWARLHEEDREDYRKMARGEVELYGRND